MTNLLQVIQSIAVNAVNASNPASLCFGTVTNESPLEIRLNESTLTISGDAILLTESVVERKLTIDKHLHTLPDNVKKHTHPVNGNFNGTVGGAAASGTVNGNASASTDIGDKTDNTVLSVHWDEFGVSLDDKQITSSDEKVEIILTRKLEKDDKVIMLRLMGGQKFLVLSRVFKREDEDED